MDTPLSGSLFTFPLPEGKMRHVLQAWLILGVCAIAGAGVYSILPVLFRSPHFQEYIPFKDFFHTTIVVHVDLSVLVWMLAISSMLWAILGNEKYYRLYLTAFALGASGALAIGLSPFLHEANPLMNNYIPVLQNPVFFLGLALFACALLMQICLTFISFFPLQVEAEQRTSQHFGIYYAAIITALALVAFVLSYLQVTQSPDLESFSMEHFYELVFWGGGHTLQFTYTHVMVIAWLWLAGGNGYALPIKEQFVNFLLSLNVMFIIPGIVVYFIYTADSPENINFFTEQMRIGLGIAATLIGLAIGWALLTQPRGLLCSTPEFSCLLSSLFLFVTGGVVGFLIRGYNVTIPAHYHGSIVGVTLAFMGLCYHFLPRLGFREVKGWMATIQPYLYGGGQLLHVIGLAVSGGYGVLRKTAGANVDPQAYVWMGLIVIGGLLAILGGLLFVVVVANAILRKNPEIQRFD